jgi:CheY-like chemotaxis protein
LASLALAAAPTPKCDKLRFALVALAKPFRRDFTRFSPIPSYPHTAPTMTESDATPDNVPANSPDSTPIKPHVLLVDDDAEIIESMRYALENHGFKVSIARDGNQGLALAEKMVPDLLILDMMMPKRSGFLVLEQLRRDGNDGVRVIMITGNEGNRHQQYAELLGVDDYIRKPFPMDRLIESAKRLVEKS